MMGLLCIQPFEKTRKAGVSLQNPEVPFSELPGLSGTINEKSGCVGTVTAGDHSCSGLGPPASWPKESTFYIFRETNEIWIFM